MLRKGAKKIQNKLEMEKKLKKLMERKPEVPLADL